MQLEFCIQFSPVSGTTSKRTAVSSVSSHYSQNSVMSIFVASVKALAFVINILCMTFGVTTICVAVAGLRQAEPDTEEHSFLIVSIILGSLLCMTTFFGCYGIVSELLGVTIIYAIFMLLLLVVQYLQVNNFQPERYQLRALQHLEDAWSMVEHEPKRMQTMENRHNCCALFSSRDYNYKRLIPPNSCYSNNDCSQPSQLRTHGCLEAVRNYYEAAAKRERLFNLTMIVSEVIVAIYAAVLSVLFYRDQHRLYMEPLTDYIGPRLNHVSSRNSLISNQS